MALELAKFKSFPRKRESHKCYFSAAKDTDTSDRRFRGYDRLN